MRKTIFVASGLICAAMSANAQNYSADDLARRAIERRAVEAVIWGMPAVNFDLMLQAVIGAKAKANQVVYWSRLPDWKNQTLTPNPDVIYLMPFFDTKDVGPMVMEIPPADPEARSPEASTTLANRTGRCRACRRRQGRRRQVSHPAARIQGQAPKGYIVLHSPHLPSYALLRSNLASGSKADVAKAVAYGKRVKVYPLSRAANPPATTFVDAIDVVFDSTIPYDLRFFLSLDRFVQHEPWIERDKAMIDMLKSVGIEKGKKFEPEQGRQAILKEALREAHAWLDNATRTSSRPPFNEGKQWVLPALPGVSEGMMTNFASPMRTQWKDAASRIRWLFSAPSISARASTT